MVRLSKGRRIRIFPGEREALAAIDAGEPAVMVVGRAGTGKTRLVRYLCGRPGSERQAVVSPTGIAALNAQAQTIHSISFRRARLPRYVPG